MQMVRSNTSFTTFDKHVHCYTVCLLCKLTWLLIHGNRTLIHIVLQKQHIKIHQISDMMRSRYLFGFNLVSLCLWLGFQVRFSSAGFADTHKDDFKKWIEKCKYTIR